MFIIIILQTSCSQSTRCLKLSYVKNYKVMTMEPAVVLNLKYQGTDDR